MLTVFGNDWNCSQPTIDIEESKNYNGNNNSKQYQNNNSKIDNSYGAKPIQGQESTTVSSKQTLRNVSFKWGSKLTWELF